MGHHFWGEGIWQNFMKASGNKYWRNGSRRNVKKVGTDERMWHKNIFPLAVQIFAIFSMIPNFFPYNTNLGGKWRVFNFKTSQFCTNFTIWSKQATEAWGTTLKCCPWVTKKLFPWRSIWGDIMDVTTDSTNSTYCAWNSGSERGQTCDRQGKIWWNTKDLSQSFCESAWTVT